MITDSIQNIKIDILQRDYEHDRWLKLVEHVFKNRDIFKPSSYQPVLMGNPNVTKAFQFGLVYLSDERRLALVDVELTNTKVISRNRVELRNIADRLIMGGFNGVLAVFHTPGQLDYRLSLITRTSTFSKEGVLVTEQTYPKRYTYLLGPNESCTTAARQLNALAENTRPTLDDVVSTFSVEKLSTEFFKEYKFHYEKKFLPHVDRLAGANGLDNPLFRVDDESLNKKEREEAQKKRLRDFTKRLLGRIVFLYFVQKKSWLGADPADADYQHGGDGNFLVTLFEEGQKSYPDQFYADQLARLFFDTLNNPERPNDEFVMPSGRQVRVPYLNGGLFDETGEPDRTLIWFPPDLFCQPDRKLADTPNQRGLFDFMNSYNFTIYEDSPEDLTVAVDPEMLGHIFENLLEENREKGAIYTPREVVHFMCQESLTEYLTTHLPGEQDAIRQVVQQKQIGGIRRNLLSDIDRLLQQVRICDPAIGSGAFPVGLLQEISAIKEVIRYEEGFKPESLARVKGSIIQQSIYGVDIEPGAVEIARLRFWLSLIVDEVKPRPLPNLDFKIMVGDSLVPKYERAIVSIDWNTSDTSGNQHLLDEIRRTLKEIAQKQGDFFRPDQHGHLVTPAEKKAALADIRRLKIKFLYNQLALTKLRYEATNATTTGTLFAAQPTKKELAHQQQIAEQVRTYDTLMRDLNALEHHPDRPLKFFDWKLEFAEVMNETVAGPKTGFDIVIANPPYMRVQEIQKSFPHEKTYFEQEKDLKEVAKQAYDLANLFVVQALKKLSHDNTVNCFIFPHKFFNSDSATDFRDFLLRGQYMDKIAHFGANRVFNDADTYVCIALFSKRKNEGFDLQKLPYLPDRRSDRLSDDLVRLMADRERYQPVSYDQLRRASKLYGGNQWLFFDGPDGYSLFEQIYRAGSRRFNDVLEIFVGLQTSNDKLFLLDVDKQDDRYLWGRNGLSNTVWQVERTFFKPMLRGRDVQRYAPLQTDNYVFFPYRQTGKKATPVPLTVLEKDFPLTYCYVMEQADEFKGREGGKSNAEEFWYRHGRENNLVKFEQRKLSSMEICTNHANVTLDENSFYHNTKVYSWVKAANVPESYEYMLAIANSSVLWWFLKNTGDTLQGDARTLKTNYLNPFPLPDSPAPAIERAIATLVRYLLWLNDPVNPQANSSVSNKSVAAYFRQVVDGCVCELYVGDEMRQKQVDILPFVEKEVSVATDSRTAEAISSLFLTWQKLDSEVRNRLILFTTRSPDILAKLLKP